MFYIKIFSRYFTVKCLEPNIWKSFWPSLDSKSAGFLNHAHNSIKTCVFHRQYSQITCNRGFRNNFFALERKSTSQKCRTYSQGLSPTGRRRLQWATYLSCAIGVGLLSAIGWRSFRNFRRTARGMEPIEPERGVTNRQVMLYRYRGYVLPTFVADVMDNVFRFDVRDDDVWIVTFPKAGTTWVMEIVYLLQTDLRYDKAMEKNVEERVPFFEFIVPGLRTIKKLPSPRIIKTHLPFSLLPTQMKRKKPRIIYVARNPKDTIVSFYHFTKSLAAVNYRGDMDHFISTFLNNTMPYGPWWKHVKEGWQLRDQDNVLFLTYEEMKRDLPGCIRMISRFLDKSLSESEIEKLAEHCTFKNMKVNPSVNYNWFEGWMYKKEHEQFMRKGIVGDWKNILSEEMAKEVDELVATELKDTGLSFYDAST